MKPLAFIAIPGLLLAALPAWLASLGGAADHDSAGRIVAVNLRASWIADGDLLELARLPQLERLDLSRTRISDQGLGYLKTATSLRDVNLSFAEKIGDPAHAIIKHWKNLRRLNLRGTVVADATAAAAASLPHLEALDVTDTQVGDAGLEQLALARELKDLAIGNLRLTDLGFQSLRQLTGLVILDLAGRRPAIGGVMEMSAQAVEALASLRGLRVLRLGHVKFPVKSLAILKTMPNVESLSLAFCPEIRDAAIAYLADWKSLRLVDLHGTKMTAEGVASLRKQRPYCKFLWE